MPNVTQPPLPHRDKRPGVTPEAIADAALVLIQERGMSSLTMRSLAQRLGVYPATVYWHVGNKAQLVALAFQRVFEQIELPETDSMVWSEWVRRLAYTSRECLARHPRLAAYFTSQIQVSAASLQLSDKLLTVLSEAGFRGQHLVSAYNAVTSNVFGWISGEYATAPEDADDSWEDFFEEQLTAAGTANLPALRDGLGLLANHAFMLRWQSGDEQPMLESYDFMLDVLVDGLTVQLERLG